MGYETWVTAPGMPPVILDFSTVLLEESSAIADGYISLAGAASPANFADFNDFYSSLKVIFIERLSARLAEVDLAIFERIDGDYNLTMTVDPECKQRWFKIGILSGYQPVFEQAHIFISSMGRLKYLMPIY
jgi:leukotriene-A4 hydrolase